MGPRCLGSQGRVHTSQGALQHSHARNRDHRVLLVGMQASRMEHSRGPCDTPVPWGMGSVHPGS